MGDGPATPTKPCAPAGAAPRTPGARAAPPAKAVHVAGAATPPVTKRRVAKPGVAAAAPPPGQRGFLGNMPRTLWLHPGCPWGVGCPPAGGLGSRVRWAARDRWHRLRDSR